MKFTLISSCVAIAIMTLAVEAAPNGKKLSIPLAKNNDFKPNAKRSLLKALAKYNKTPKGGEISPQSTGSVPVVDVGSDLEYYGIVTVGTPGVQLKLDFDTGSSDLWFASTLCSTCSNSHTKYDPNKSSTYKADGRPWSISYGDGSTASGVLAKDSVNLGGLVIKDQTIGLAKRESSAFAEDVIDGLLGLAFNSITTVRGVKTPVDNLISQGLISRPIYGVYLGKAKNGGGGEYLFGGYDSTKFKGPLTTVPIDNSEGFWGVTVKGTKIGSKSISGSFSAILDTGTTLLLLPDNVAASVARAYGASDNGDGTYTITCDSSKLQPLVFTLGSSTFQVPADSLIYEKSGSKCIAGFAAGGDLAILGDVFLKNNYVVFNQQVPEVQIAPVAH
ncbi:Putative Rhizopuspepsin-like protein [Rhizopus microsporus]|nr:Putative Rhizopuspepsin-like protein [Rhizopus microsporus]